MRYRPGLARQASDAGDRPHWRGPDRQPPGEP